MPNPYHDRRGRFSSAGNRGGPSPTKRANISDREADALSDIHEGSKPYSPEIDWDRAKKELSPQEYAGLQRAVAKRVAGTEKKQPTATGKTWASGGYSGTVDDQLRAAAKARPSGAETYEQAKARARRGDKPVPPPSGRRNSPNADRTTWQR